MRSTPLALTTLLSVFFVFSCTHTPAQMSEVRKADYQKSTEIRISRMEDNAENLRIRENQLLGKPRQELGKAVSDLEREIETSKAVLSELKERNVDTWVHKKSEVDRQLRKMETAYDDALEVILAD